MMKKKILSWICVLTTICSFAGLGGCKNVEKSNGKWFMSKTAEYTESEKGVPLPVYTHYYDQLGGPDVMPIGTYSGPTFDFLTDERFLEFQELGINFFAKTFDATQNWDKMQKLLELSEKYGFGVFSEDISIGGMGQTSTITADKIDERVQKYLKYDSFLGIGLIDEPSAEACKEYGKTISQWRKSKYASDYDMYYNAFSDCGSLSENGKITYEEYVRTYIEEFGADYFSYDRYPFRSYPLPQSSDYLEEIALVRNLCQEYEIPFWGFIGAGTSWETPVTECVPATEGEYLWNINTYLAYGAKGIQYFTLNQYEGFLYHEDELSATRSGLYGAYGNKNRWWYFTKKANVWIKAVDHILMNSAHVGVIFHGDSPCKPSDGVERNTWGDFRQMTSVQGDDALVGCFDYYGGTALFVVNNSLTNGNAKITLTFDDVYGYEVYQRDTVTDIAGNALQLKLDVGEAALVVLK